MYTVVAADDGKTYLALKTSWQDVARVSDQMIVLNKLSVHNQHPNIVIPSSLEPKGKGGKLGSIREFLAEDTQQLKMENRILSVTISELRRPVAYFWSPHDFVRGVIGALLGHQYLCEIGILHCDISENNIVLSLCQRGLGALIDFDMAIAGHPNVHLDSPPPRRIRTNDEILASLVQRSSLLPADGTSHEAQPTGTIPYMSIGVLRGEPHTHYDDIESLLYVLVLFFFSYQGPLPKEALRKAMVQGFTQPVGVARLSHVTPWPDMFKGWARGSLRDMSDHKYADIAPAFRDIFLEDCYPHIRSRWDPVSRSTAPAIAGLILDCCMLFSGHCLKVARGQFIEVLQEWLKCYASEESKYVYPFDA